MLTPASQDAPYEAVLAWAAAHRRPRPIERAEPEPGRVLATAITAAQDFPTRALAEIDGIALSAAVTHGAGEYAPALVPARRVTAGDTLIDAEDAVVAADTIDWLGGLAAIVTPVAAGTGCCAAGSMIAAGVVALPAGAVIGPAALGLLAAIGVTRLDLVRRPRVALLTPPALTPLLTAAITADGGIAEALPGPDATGAAWARAGRFDLVIAADALPGATVIHGVAIQPGGAAAFGDLDGVPAIVLPRDAEGALAAYFLLARAILRAGSPHRPSLARLTASIPSALGYTQLAWLRLDGGAATPAGRGLHAATAGAYTIVPAHAEGYAAGTMVDAWT